MAETVIAEFAAAPGRLDDLVDFLRGALPDTHRFEGCISLEVYVDRATDTVAMIESWDSHEAYDRYLAWRMESGMVDEAVDLLAGGAEGMVIRKLEPLAI